MMRITRKIFIVLLLLITSGIFGQPPAGYYDPANGLSGTPLQAALHNIIKNHNSQAYSSLYQHFQSTDRKANLSVWDMYSDVPGGTPPYVYYYNSGMECGNYTGEGQCFNREHSWPNSWFGGNVPPMYSDLYHLYPTDGYVNNRRSNYPFGTVSSPTWTSLNGSKVGPCTYPGYTGAVFEPINEYKGDFARSYFYMSVRYYGLDGSWPGSPMTNGAQLYPWALAMLMQWHQNDPVSPKEVSRNNAVYVVQNNRNPFIDHPEYVTLIWGSPSAVNVIGTRVHLHVYPNPVEDFCFIEGLYPSQEKQLCLHVFDMTGREVYTEYVFEDSGIRVNTTSLEKGIFILMIVEPGKLPGIARLIKL